MKKTSNEGWFSKPGQFLMSTPYLLGVMLVVILVLFTLSQTFDQNTVSYAYRIGDVAQRDIKAPRDFLIEDKEVNQAKKNQVKEGIRTVYDFDGKLVADTLARVNAAMALGRKLFQQPDPRDDDDSAPLPDPTFERRKPFLASP